jgi:hypothetical protein
MNFPMSNQFQLSFLDELRVGPAHISRIYTKWDILSPFVFSNTNSIPDNTPVSEVQAKLCESTDKTTGEHIEMEVKPAMLTGREKTKFRFAGEREQIVSAALRGLIVRGAVETQEYAKKDSRSHESKGPRILVGFSIRQLRAELETTNHTLSHDEIVESLNVLKSTELKITITKEGRPPTVYSIRYFDNYYEQEDKRIVILNEFETAQIMSGNYRAFHYERMMLLPDPISRELYKLIHAEHRGAVKPSKVLISLPPPFRIKLSDLAQRGILPPTEKRRQINRVEKALKNMAEDGIFHFTSAIPNGWTRTIEKRTAQGKGGGRAGIKDVEWQLYLSEREAEQIFESNKEAMSRHSIYQNELSSSRISRAQESRKRITNPHGPWASKPKAALEAES